MRRVLAKSGWDARGKVELGGAAEAVDGLELDDLLFDGATRVSVLMRGLLLF